MADQDTVQIVRYGVQGEVVIKGTPTVHNGAVVVRDGANRVIARIDADDVMYYYYKGELHMPTSR